MALLIVIDGPEKGKTFALEQFNIVMVGRDHHCTFQILDPQMSRQHLQIKRIDDGAAHAAIDFHSSNGVFLNGVKIDSETRLAPGDILAIGNSEIAYSADNDPKAEANQELVRKKLSQGAVSTVIGRQLS
jgi:pSer/pThr/pTyr-binding forkhead associated (FHA) protein